MHSFHERLGNLTNFVLKAHGDRPKKPSNAFRKWDGKTPYGIHPTWCAMTLMTETTLPEDLRYIGAQALLLHDILEDTTAELPAWINPEVVELVRDMTFNSFADEMERIWTKNPRVRLLKLYDKVSNLLDGTWMSCEKRRNYLAFTRSLYDNVEENFGGLNILTIAKSVMSR